MTTLTAADGAVALRFGLWMELGEGRENARPGSEVAAALGVGERTVRSLVDELIDDGHLVGSVCSGETRGYFRIVSLEDLEVGTRHLVSRARSLHVRVARLRRAALQVTNHQQQVLDLFDLEKEAPG